MILSIRDICNKRQISLVPWSLLNRDSTVLLYYRLEGETSIYICQFRRIYNGQMGIIYMCKTGWMDGCTEGRAHVISSISSIQVNHQWVNWVVLCNKILLLLRKSFFPEKHVHSTLNWDFQNFEGVGVTPRDPKGTKMSPNTVFHLCSIPMYLFWLFEAS